MIDKFGKVMIYVNDPKTNADFWVSQLGFTQIKVDHLENKVLSVELAPTLESDAHIVLFNRAVVEETSPEIHLETPSILFSSYDIAEMRGKLAAEGVTVGEVWEVGGRKTFNFADNEGNYFAVEEIPSP